MTYNVMAGWNPQKSFRLDPYTPDPSVLINGVTANTGVGVGTSSPLDYEAAFKTNGLDPKTILFQVQLPVLIGVVH